MPSWSIRYEGALDDQQINDIVVYLVDLSSKNVPFKDNVCINEEASAKALENAGRPTRGIRDGVPRLPHRLRHPRQGRGRRRMALILFVAASTSS